MPAKHNANLLPYLPPEQPGKARKDSVWIKKQIVIREAADSEIVVGVALPADAMLWRMRGCEFGELLLFRRTVTPKVR